MSKPLIGLTSCFSENDEWYYLSANYSRAVAEAGGVPVQLPLLPELAAELAARLDGILLCGSRSDVDPARYVQPRHPAVKVIHPDLDETSCGLLEVAFREKKPVLAICYGMQLLNVFLEGTLIQHIPQGVAGAIEHEDRRTLHAVLLEPESRMAEWAGGAGEIVVNSTHHQAIQKLGLGLRIAGRAPDGTVEAVEGGFPDHLVIGVQWHPERIWKQEQVSRRVFAELVRAASVQTGFIRRSAGVEVDSTAIEKR